MQAGVATAAWTEQLREAFPEDAAAPTSCTIATTRLPPSRPRPGAWASRRSAQLSFPMAKRREGCDVDKARSTAHERTCLQRPQECDQLGALLRSKTEAEHVPLDGSTLNARWPPSSRFVRLPHAVRIEHLFQRRH